MTVFIVFIGEIPNIYKKLEISNEELFGDDNLICSAMYVDKIIMTTTDKLSQL
jgi:hypothetical protein